MKTGKKLALATLLTACSLSIATWAAPVSQEKAPAVASKNTDIQEISWDQLVPPVEPSVIEDYQAGKMDPKAVDDYLEKLGKQSVASLDGTYTRMPGYLVPLNLNEKQIATELLLVPSAGSCIHVPPPPPNQTIYVKFAKGINVEDAGYTPYWVQGRLKVETKSSEYTDALYTIEVDEITEWKWDEE